MVRDGAHRVTPSSSSARFRATRGEPMSIAAVAQTGARCRQTAKAILSPEQTEPSVQSAEYKFYEAFAPKRARALVRRLEFCYTPKHGSWLNIAEDGLSAPTRQCIRDR